MITRACIKIQCKKGLLIDMQHNYKQSATKHDAKTILCDFGLAILIICTVAS